MKKYLLWLTTFFLLSSGVFAEAPSIALEHAPIDPHDMASIQRGAKFFSTTCMVCHTLIYLRYNTLAQKAGVLYDKMPINVKAWPLDVRPPDLSLEAEVRGVDWIYTYLHSFYTDPSRPTGFNNLVVPNTAMSNVLLGMQGVQVLATDVKKSNRIFGNQLQWYDLLELQSKGSMTQQQFDATITDVVNFLGYAAAPYQNEQSRLGYWVIGFLIILFFLAYLLKKSYWKDIK